MNQEVMNLFNAQAPAQVFDSIRISRTVVRIQMQRGS